MKRHTTPNALFTDAPRPGFCTMRSKADDAFIAVIAGPHAPQYGQLFKAAPQMLRALQAAERCARRAYVDAVNDGSRPAAIDAFYGELEVIRHAIAEAMGLDTNTPSDGG
jgi:hypothetical protein